MGKGGTHTGELERKILKNMVHKGVIWRANVSLLNIQLSKGGGKKKAPAAGRVRRKA